MEGACHLGSRPGHTKQPSKLLFCFIPLLTTILLIISSCGSSRFGASQRVVGDEDTDLDLSNRSYPASDPYDENEKERRYAEYKDSAAMLRLKLAQVDYINEGRRRYKAPPVRLDILASRVANRMAREACLNNFRGHFNMRGEKPYQRYAFAGGRDHVLENTSASSSSVPFERTDQSFADLMRQAHERFMAEIAPNNGHKKTSVDKRHNFVGIGADIEGGEFRYYEEYLDRYLEFGKVKTDLAVNESVKLSVRPLHKGDLVYLMMVYYEPLPKPMTAAQINRTGSYHDFTDDRTMTVWPSEIEKCMNGSVYNLPLSFTKPGSYYVNIYISGKPYTGGRVSTKGRVQACGIVFLVR